jgi:hypothetical protein
MGLIVHDIAVALDPKRLLSSRLLWWQARTFFAHKEALPLMHSSAAVAGRALIMLAFIVGIPAFALSGASWSQLVKRLQDFNWSTITDLAFVPASNSTSRPMAGQGPVEPIQTEAPHTMSATPAPAIETPTAPGTVSSAVVPTAYQAPVEASATALPTAKPSDQFSSIEHRLRQLGATYYLLESWGSQQQMYRFYCKMAIGGSAEFTRYFESTHGDPLQAMLEVLRQVEAWHNGTNKQELTARK